MPFGSGLHNRYRIVLINTGNGQDTPETNEILRFYTTSTRSGQSLLGKADFQRWNDLLAIRFLL